MEARVKACSLPGADSQTAKDFAVGQTTQKVLYQGLSTLLGVRGRRMLSSLEVGSELANCYLWGLSYQWVRDKHEAFLI